MLDGTGQQQSTINNIDSRFQPFAGETREIFWQRNYHCWLLYYLLSLITYHSPLANHYSPHVSEVDCQHVHESLPKKALHGSCRLDDSQDPHVLGLVRILMVDTVNLSWFL